MTPRSLILALCVVAGPIAVAEAYDEWWDVPIRTPMARDQLLPGEEGARRLEQQRLSFDFGATLETSLSVDHPPTAAVSAQRAQRARAERAAAIVTGVDEIVADRDAAILLGKALFWEMRAGSDGQTACATCHYEAGADARTDAGGAVRRTSLGVAARSLAGWPSPGDDVEPSVAWNARLGAGFCQREWGALASARCEVAAAPPPAVGAPEDQPIGERCVNGGGVRGRMSTCKNAPTVIGAVAFDRLFHDASARSVFNGYDHRGDDAASDPIGIWRKNGQGLERVLVRLDGSALASQATRPILARGEMSWDGRRFYHLARKLLDTRPLRAQVVSPADPVLGDALRQGAPASTYRELIQRAFRPEYTTGTARVRPTQVRNPVDGRSLNLSQLEANFALFWGLSIQLYEETLVPDDTPFDRYYLALSRGEAYTGSDFPQEARDGFHAFVAAGCELCHLAPEFSSAARSHISGPLGEFEAPDDAFEEPDSNLFVDWLLAGRPWTRAVIESMNIPLFPESEATIDLSPRKIVDYDNGYYNIGMFAERLAPGLGADLGPYATRQEIAAPRAATLAANPAERARYGAGGVATDAPLDSHQSWILGSTKSSSLRNVALTAPYYSDADMGADDLLSAIAVYRGMPFARTNAHLHPEIRDIVFSNADLANIARFLRALTDERVEARTGVFATPSIRLPTVEATNAAGVSPASALRCVAASPPSDGVSLGCAEVCNGRDDDGNGRIDDGAGVCTDPVRQFNGHSYIFSATRAMTFDQAVGWCNAQGYDLVTPSTAAENDWLWDVAWNARDNQGLINTEAWIGLLSEAGALRWVNGDPGTTFALAEPAPVDGNRWGAYTAHGPTAANWRFSRTGISKRVICESR